MRLLPFFCLFFCLACNLEPTSEEAQKLPSSLFGNQAITTLLLADRFEEARDSLVIQMARPQVQETPILRANIQYFKARLDYQAEDFPLAMAAARKAVKDLDRAEDLKNNNVMIQALHLLAQLHFDHAAHTDSIGYYQRWAASLITEDTPVPIQAEQQLCYALAQLYDYEYKTQLGAARLGKSLLASYPKLNDVYARLLVAEGLGLKKHADQQPEPSRSIMLEEAAELMAEAVVRFKRINSIRWREAQREKVIIVSRFQDRNRFEVELRPLLLPTSPAPAAAPPPFGFPDRLRGYFHHRLENADSTLFYYQKFQPQAPEFDFHLNDETHWTLIQYGITDGQLSLAETNVRDQLVLYGCLEEGVKNRPTDQLIEYSTFLKACPYAFCDYGRIRLAEYNNYGKKSALQEANAIFQYILSEWENVFINGEEESALNQLSEITYKIINNANEAAFAQYQQAPSVASAEQLLQTMERTKAFLLLNDRFKKQGNNDVNPQVDSLKKWQSQLNILKEQEVRLGRLTAAERRQAQEFRNQFRALRQSVRQQLPSTNQVFLPSLPNLQRELPTTKGILTFATGNDRLIGHYFDRDTTFAFVTGNIDSITQQITQLLKYLKTDASAVTTAEYVPVAYALYGQLIGPLQPRLSRLEEILIIPAGTLRQLPFATLLTDTTSASQWESLPYLLAKTSLTYSTSLRLERINTDLRPTSYKNATMGTWTNPDFNNTFKRSHAKLRQLVPGGSHFYDLKECSTTTFSQHLPDYDIINLVLHADGNPYNAYRNHLYFFAADSLNGAAISQLSTNASLVLLTACETGLGTTTVGEGTFSISRGFQQIGVPDVIYSLYEISAAASAELTHRFYFHLYNGQYPTDALNSAQREMMLGEQGAGLAFPGYWGGVVKG